MSWTEEDRANLSKIASHLEALPERGDKITDALFAIGTAILAIGDDIRKLRR